MWPIAGVLAMSCAYPAQTIGDLIEWYRDARTADLAQIEALARHGSASIGLGDVSENISRTMAPLSIEELHRDIMGHNFCQEFRGNGWLTRAGTLWGCNWAAHEFLLRAMGLDIHNAEAAGWVRISRQGVRVSAGATQALSAAQRKVAKQWGFLDQIRIYPREILPGDIDSRAQFFEKPVLSPEFAGHKEPTL